jgi:Zn-dependent M28 family amino/carboxypeptidase
VILQRLLGSFGRGWKNRQDLLRRIRQCLRVAALLALAKAYKALPKAPKRTILFIAATAEERGLLGAKYYASHPLYPLKNTVANINIDGVNAWGKTAHIENITSGHSSIDDLLEKYTKTQGRLMAKDTRAELVVSIAPISGNSSCRHTSLYAKARNGYLNQITMRPKSSITTLRTIVPR